MIIVADGGATKTDWRVLKEGIEITRVQTSGFNPYLVSSDEIEHILWKELQPLVDNKNIDSVYYYGAGCSTITKVNTVVYAFENIFPNARIIVDHDLIGAAHALCGNHPGIACILGTGSNSCFYDGNKIVNQIFSLGYFFGDEGSGASLGKTLLSAYLHNELPRELVSALENFYKPGKESILDAVYKQPAPSRFLASFSTFINQHRDHPFISELLYSEFSRFFRYQVCFYPNHKEVTVHFAGSVAFHYQDILRSIAGEMGIETGKFIQAPIEGLVDYHKQD